MPIGPVGGAEPGRRRAQQGRAVLGRRGSAAGRPQLGARPAHPAAARDRRGPGPARGWAARCQEGSSASLISTPLLSASVCLQGHCCKASATHVGRVAAQQLAVAVHNHLKRVAYEAERRRRRAPPAAAAQQQQPGSLSLRDPDAPVGPRGALYTPVPVLAAYGQCRAVDRAACGVQRRQQSPGKPADALCIKCNAPLHGSYSAGPGQELKAGNEWEASPLDDPATPLPEWALQADIELEKLLSSSPLRHHMMVCFNFSKTSAWVCNWTDTMVLCPCRALQAQAKRCSPRP